MAPKKKQKTAKHPVPAFQQIAAYEEQPPPSSEAAPTVAAYQIPVGHLVHFGPHLTRKLVDFDIQSKKNQLRQERSPVPTRRKPQSCLHRGAQPCR
jgi:hypothetical protein